MAIELGAAGASPDGVGDVVEHLFRTESARLTAILTRILGPAHLELAEDSTQEALLAALKHWPVDGVPSNPSAWLLQVARRRALDALRRDASTVDDASSNAAIEALVAGPGDREVGEAIADDELRLIFLCCHPAVSRDSRVALTLKLAAGFGVGEIARAFLADETAVAQRLVRAKRALREALAGAPLTMPSAAEIPARLDAVLDVLYLMFNEGHTAHEGTSLLRRDLCHEALRLTELLLTSEATAEPRVHALAALFCFHAARLDARTDAIGALVRLPQQDRTRWDADLVARGVRHLDDSAWGDELTVYHLEAEIAGFHATAPSWEVTEWDRILAAYDLLLIATGSAVVALNRVVAVWHARSAGQALEELDALASRDALQDYHLYHAVRAELLMATGRAKEARTAYEAALGLARLEPARDLLRDRIAGLSGSHVDSEAPRPS
jgi:RNA polymerase sigma-70 factor (ECF subfamily)